MYSDDQTARNQIAQDLDTTFLVEAGAGSGKTTSLVGRMLALIETGKATAEQIAAITFTRKAADELRSRFRLELEKRLRTANEPQSGRLRQAMKEIDRCYIGTIHSFCGRLLRERPIEARLDPMFREMEEDDAEAFRDQCWDEYLMQLAEHGQEHLIAGLESLQVNVEILREVYKRVSQYSDVEVDITPLPRPDFDLIRLSLPPMLEEAFPYIPASKPEMGWDALQQMVRDGNRLISLHGLGDDRIVLQLALLFERNVEATLNRWTDKNMAKQFKVSYREWQIRVLHPFLQSWREYLYPQLIDFVMPAIRYCERRRSELGLVDFQDLLMRATSLLREHREVRMFFAERYTRLFVDEFQDTDPIQAELMFLMTGSCPDDTDWRHITPKPGSLFVVGDPKQSIYRFRRADISTYNTVKSIIALNGEVLRLSANFRSVHAIGEFINNEFSSRFPVTESEHQAAFVQMETRITNPVAFPAGAGVEVGAGVLHGIHTLTYDKMSGGKAAIAEADAERVTRYIAWACSGHLQIQEKDSATGSYTLRNAMPGDFLILLKRREFLYLYAEKLEAYGVPAVTAGSSPLYEEVVALAILAKSLNDADDRISLLAVLRGMLFGVSDNALFHYKMEGFSFTYTYLPEPTEVSVTAMPVFVALQRLSSYREKIRNLPAVSALMSMIDDLGIIPLAAVRYSGSNRAGTLIKLLQMLQSDDRRAADWTQLCAYLVRQAEEAALEGSDLFAGQQDAVRIMNLHKAKGLEAPVVFLACPCGEFDHNASEHVDRSGATARGYFSITRRKNFQSEMIAHPQGWTELAERERLYTNAEKERLLYVAGTRAKQLLVISRYPDRRAIDPWSGFDSSLQEADELEDVAVGAIARAIYDGVHDEATDEACSREHRNRLARPTYRVDSVTELAKGSSVQPPRPVEGRGMAFGSAVHRCVELLGTRRTLEELNPEILAIAAEEGMQEALVPDVRIMLEQLTSHPVWERAMSAKTTLHELPFRTHMEAEASEGNPSRLLLKGIIDLLFEEEDGWVVVDFKTDVYASIHQELFVDYYRPQVMAYTDELQRSFGMRIKEAGLYFLHRNEYVML
jgi:ATP-dependent helicase/nuclease subunit A